MIGRTQRKTAQNKAKGFKGYISATGLARRLVRLLRSPAGSPPTGDPTRMPRDQLARIAVDELAALLDRWEASIDRADRAVGLLAALEATGRHQAAAVLRPPHDATV